MSSINLLVLGKTGVGKSSFCNYIFEQDIFRHGSGEPVTGWDENFSFHDIAYNNFKLKVHDTVGIETNNLKEWKEKLDDFLKLKTRSTSPSQRSFGATGICLGGIVGVAGVGLRILDTLTTRHGDLRFDHRLCPKPMDWIHGAFYLINAASARVEKSEIDLINCLIEKNIPVQIVLTNSDAAKENEINAIKADLHSKLSISINISEVCSVDIKTRVGVKNKFGKDSTLKQFLAHIDIMLRKKIYLYCLDTYHDAITDMKLNLNRAIENSNIGFWALIKEAMSDGGDINLEEAFDFNLEQLNDLGNEYSDVFNSLDFFLDEMGFENTSSFTEQLEEIQSKIDDSIHNSSNALEDEMNEISNRFESDGFINKLKVTADVLKIVVNLKEFLKRIMDEMIEPSLVLIVNGKNKFEREFK